MICESSSYGALCVELSSFGDFVVANLWGILVKFSKGTGVILDAQN
jgi:hypothetical protein